MAESSSHQQHKKHNSSSSAGNGGGIAGDSKKWACMYCTYLNWEANFKCVLCNQARHRPMLIEELCPPADCRTEPTHSDSIFPDDHQLQLVGIGVDEMSRWPCPTCTYMNCRRTKRCIQCHTDRPTAYTTPPNSKNGSPKGSSSDAGNHGQSIHQPVGRKNSQHQQQNLQETQQLISRALNKWSCSSCTFDNWPTASKCTICGQPRSSAAIREQSRSPPNQSQQQQRKRSESQHQKQLKCLEENTGTAGDLEQLERLSIVAGAEKFKQQEYASALDIYARRFLANDPVEKLFFRAAGAIGHSELQMVNKVVDYLINEGNLQRSLTAFEARLMNQYIARGGTCRVVGFERADSLFFLAKKSDSLDLMKLIRRVRTDDDRLPCSLNCVTRTRLFAKVTAQCMAVRDGPSGSGQFFKCQFIAHPYNFNLLNLPMPGSDLSLAVQNALFRPAPCIPPQFCYIDCFDAMASQGGLIVGRPPNFLMRNRGAANSLYDSVFQTMFGVCDRFNILRAATKYTMHRSSNLFKIRWIEQQRRMIRDCGLSVAEGELDADWNDILNSVGEEDECTEPIHIWALAHICCRPIIVCPMDDPVDVDQLLSPLGGNGAGIGRSGSPREQGGRVGADNQTQDTTEGSDNRRSQHEEKAQPRQTNYHIYEGIYLPILWAPSAPITRSPLIICYRNGLFHAVAISDALYQRDAEVQRYVRIKRPLRRPGTAGDSLFRFLCRTELDNSALLAQFILFGHSTAQQLSIRREPHPFLMETLHFYKNWMQAMLQLSGDGNGTCGTSSTNQLETRMDTIMMGKKRKGGDSPSPALLQPHQQALMVQLFSPQITQQCLSHQQQQSEAGCQEEATFGRCWQNDD